MAIERKFGDPQMYPKSDNGVKIEGKNEKKIDFWSPTLGGAACL